MMGLKKWSAALIAAALLTACGGGGGGGTATEVAADDVTAGVNSEVASALRAVDFTFADGVAELGTAAATTVAFTSEGASPAFSIASGGATATGTTTFGSCIFKVTSSSFPVGHRLEQGATVTVNPCSIRFGTQGAPADSIARARAAVFILGAAASTGTTVTVTVNPGGTITVNGRDVGTVTLVPVSG